MTEFQFTVRLAGVEVVFQGPLEAGVQPAVVSPDLPAETAVAALGGDSGRLVTLIHGVRTGIDVGVIQPHHLAAIELACGGADLLEATPGDTYLTDELQAHLTSETACVAVAWVLQHEPAQWPRENWTKPGSEWIAIWADGQLQEHGRWEAFLVSFGSWPVNVL